MYAAQAAAPAASMPPWKLVGPAVPVAPDAFPVLAPPAPERFAPVLAYPPLADALPVDPDALPAEFAQVERQLQGMGAVVQTATPHDFPLPEEHETPGDYLFARLQHVEEHPEDYERPVSQSAGFAAPYGLPDAPVASRFDEDVVVIPPVSESSDTAARLTQVEIMLAQYLEILVRISADMTEFQASMEAKLEGVIDTVRVSTIELADAEVPRSVAMSEAEAEDEDMTPAAWASHLIHKHADVMADFALFVDAHGVRPADYLSGVDVRADPGPSISETLFAEILQAKAAPASAPSTSEPIYAPLLPTDEELPWREHEHGLDDMADGDDTAPEPMESSTPDDTGDEQQEEAEDPTTEVSDADSVSDDQVIEMAEVTPDAPVEDIKKALIKLQRRFKRDLETRDKRQGAAESNKREWTEKLAAAVDDVSRAAAERGEFFYKDSCQQLELIEERIRVTAASVKRLEDWSGIRRRSPRKAK